MAVNTNINLRNQIIYCVYVRNHSEEGTFKGVQKDLKRIKELGTDIIWFMPIHPIGVEGKKGSLGCPYSIKDYRNVNDEYGIIDDFKELVNEIHSLDMKCIIDVVYNHTSLDSWLVKNHIEYFYKKADGNLGNKVGDWEDVIDLDYNNKELWNYQIDTLKMWAEIVDGFRCDVASLVPIEFWEKARKEINSLHPECIWLSETVEPGYIKLNRKQGFVGHSDSEIYKAFDITYDYDILSFFNKYIDGKISLSDYINILNFQDCIYPVNYIKLRFLENHDQPRIKSRLKDEEELKNLTAFLYFQKGTTLIYAGQEKENVIRPNLFEIDKVNWNTGYDISELMKCLYKIKKDRIFIVGDYTLECDNDSDIIIGKYETEDEKVIGIFSIRGNKADIPVELNNGKYLNLIDNSELEVNEGKIRVSGKPIIIKLFK
ncbi:alpha-amylase family glycosyl hydrolase [Clostridium sp. CTA-5]